MATTEPLDLRAAVRARIEKLGITQGEAAARAGMTPGKLSVWLAGKGEIQLATFERLAAAVGLELKLRPQKRR